MPEENGDISDSLMFLYATVPQTIRGEKVKQILFLLFIKIVVLLFYGTLSNLGSEAAFILAHGS